MPSTVPLPFSFTPSFHGLFRRVPRFRSILSGIAMQDIPELSSLAEDSRWVRALARRLVRDAASADDLAQDAWVAALQDRAVLGRLKRSWIAVVMRRRVFEQRRAEAARREREGRTARNEALPSTLDMVERAATQRDLVQAVLDLDEPYRSTILWRFFEDLSARAIARRAGVPVATVHTRLSRALDKLRARLDRQYDGARSSLVMLAPFVSIRAGTFGAWMMKTSTKIAIAAVALASTLAVWSVTRGAPNPPAAPEGSVLARPADDAHAQGEQGATLVEDSAQAHRDVASGASNKATPADKTTATAASIRLHGLVLDASGHPVAGVHLATRPSIGAEFTSNGSGRFSVALAREVTSVVSADPSYATVLSGSGSTQSDAIVVVAPRIELAGTVVDETGARLQGVGVSVTLPAGFGADFGQSLDTALDKRWTAVTGADGTFALSDAPAVAGANLRAEVGAFEPHVEPVPQSGAHDLWIVMRRAGVASTQLSGIVLDMYGNRMHGARVALGTQTVFTDDGGRFEVDAAQDPVPTRIVALMTGFQPAILEPADGHFPSEIVLQLGPAPLSMSGRVIDEHDHPVQSARVWLTDPTPFGIVENEPLHVEALTSGGDKRFWAWVETDADGRFRIDGLLERDYGIGALDTRTLLQTQMRAAAGRDDVEIRLPAGQILPVVRGHVVTFEGVVIPGVPVMVQRPGFTFTYADGGTRDEFSHLAPVTTDKDGAFEFHDVPRAGVELFANGETILFAAVNIDDVVDPLDVKIRAHLRRHLQVELNAPLDRADVLRVLDADGKPMILRIMRGATSFTNRVADIVDGRSQILSLSDEARTVVLSKAGVEVWRVGVRLTSGDVETVRW